MATTPSCCPGFLSERGLGGDLSAGRGKLKDLKLEEFTGFQEPAQAQRFVTLSLYYPDKEEIQSLQQCWYRLLPRKGKVEMTYLTGANPFKSKIHMFAEGSTFPLPPSGSVQGRNPPVQPDTGDGKFIAVQWGRPFAVRIA